MGGLPHGNIISKVFQLQMNMNPVTVGVYRGKEKQFYSPIGISSDNVSYSLDFSFGSKCKIKML